MIIKSKLIGIVAFILTTANVVTIVLYDPVENQKDTVAKTRIKPTNTAIDKQQVSAVEKVPAKKALVRKKASVNKKPTEVQKQHVSPVESTANLPPKNAVREAIKTLRLVRNEP